MKNQFLSKTQKRTHPLALLALLWEGQGERTSEF